MTNREHLSSHCGFFYHCVRVLRSPTPPSLPQYQSNFTVAQGVNLSERPSPERTPLSRSCWLSSSVTWFLLIQEKCPYLIRITLPEILKILGVGKIRFLYFQNQYLDIFKEVERLQFIYSMSFTEMNLFGGIV